MAWTEAATRALLGKNTDESFSCLLRIVHDQIQGGALNVCLGEEGQDIVSNYPTTNTRYIAYPFEIECAPDVETAPQIKISIANVHRKIGATLRTIREAAKVEFRVIMTSDPNNILTEYFGFYLRHVTIDALSVEGELLQGVMSSEPYPFIRVTQLRFPSLFQ